MFGRHLLLYLQTYTAIFHKARAHFWGHGALLRRYGSFAEIYMDVWQRSTALFADVYGYFPEILGSVLGIQVSFAETYGSLAEIYKDLWQRSTALLVDISNAFFKDLGLSIGDSFL